MESQFEDGAGLRHIRARYKYLSDYWHRDPWNVDEEWSLYGLRRKLQPDSNQGYVGTFMPQHRRNHPTGKFELLHATAHVSESKRAGPSPCETKVAGHWHT
jgi:hypothetical protein